MSGIADHGPVPIRVQFDGTPEGRREASLLYLCLVHNARPWNARIRAELEQRLTRTEIFNADISENGKRIRSPSASD